MSDLNKVLAGVTGYGVTLVGLVAPADGPRATNKPRLVAILRPLYHQIKPSVANQELCEKRNIFCPSDRACCSSRLIAPGAWIHSQDGDTSLSLGLNELVVSCFGTKGSPCMQA
jgi:hypothetical protein